jgi:hypothetical protein
MLKNICILFILGGCVIPPSRAPKLFLYSLEQLAIQRGKRYTPPFDTIKDLSKRMMLTQECTQNLTDRHREDLIIQFIEEYPERYLIAEPNIYNFAVMDLSLHDDSTTHLISIHGKYLGTMEDTTLNKRHKYLVMQLPISCPFSIKEQEAISISDVLVLYDMRGDSIFPVEILDYRCSKENEDDKSSYQDICFCQKTPPQFLKFLQDYIQKVREEQDIYPMRLKKITSTTK